MFYISSVKYDDSVKKYGVTDRTDGIEEFYSTKELADMFRNYNLRIHGMTHTGSSFKFEVKTPDMILLDYLQKGGSFMLKLPNKEPMRVMYVGQSGDLSYVYFSLPDADTHKLTRKFLLENRGCTTAAANDDYAVELRMQYKRKFPTSQLSMFI